MTSFARILEDLNEAGIRYVLIGGIGSKHPLEDLFRGSRSGFRESSWAPLRRPSFSSGSQRVDGVEAPICSLADLVSMKRAVGRERDLADLADLEAAHGALPTAGE
ncbi:MAG: hypothetical protein ACTHN7_10065 [Solirubrobacterales bacterium]